MEAINETIADVSRSGGLHGGMGRKEQCGHVTTSTSNVTTSSTQLPPSPPPSPPLRPGTTVSGGLGVGVCGGAGGVGSPGGCVTTAGLIGGELEISSGSFARRHGGHTVRHSARAMTYCDVMCLRLTDLLLILEGDVLEQRKLR